MAIYIPKWDSRMVTKGFNKDKNFKKMKKKVKDKRLQNV